MLEVLLPVWYFSLFLMPLAPLTGGARSGASAGRSPMVQATADKFLVRLRAVAPERLERDLDDMWRRNNIRRLWSELPVSCHRCGFAFHLAG